MNENEIARLIINEAHSIHHEIGPGMMESAYRACLSYRLSDSGLAVQQDVHVPLIYGNVELECGYFADLLIGNKVIVEVKSVMSIEEIHHAQIMTYLRLKEKRLGLILNFNTVNIKDGIKRVVNTRL